jgi:Mg2+ and Co2+ transporter CorA
MEHQEDPSTPVDRDSEININNPKELHDWAIRASVDNILRPLNRRINNFIDELEQAVEDLEESIPEMPTEEEEKALKQITLDIDKMQKQVVEARDNINEIRNVYSTEFHTKL